ncbi:hypothetical protein [Tenacibaculum agarivorans]|uniref:hypothetical protein n=1 Tax=Tenacibaculum agarivorans TaxID=1908389 RepID=UPI00094BA28B|nr:hypothetical protein [Tenacibaculum agarivorans]
MKILYISLLLLLFSVAAHSQSEEDYQNALGLVKKAFNEKQATSLYEKFSSSLKGKLKQDAFTKTMDSLHTEKGTLSSYELILEENKERSYLTEFENASMLLLIQLSPEGEISTFTIKEY